MSKPRQLIPATDFHTPWGKFKNSKAIASNIRRYNSFPIVPDVRSRRVTRFGRGRCWTLEFANGDTAVRFNDLSVAAAKKAKSYIPTVQVAYWDGLGIGDMDSVSPSTTCLAKATKLFPAPMMPLEMLDLHAKGNLGLTFSPRFQDKRFRWQFPDAGRRRSHWLHPVLTRLYPKLGQPALFFHSQNLFTMFNKHQCSIVRDLCVINENFWEENDTYIWDPAVLSEAKRLAEDDTAQILGKCLDLLLEHVDPDLLTFLLPEDDRLALDEEIYGWQQFVRRTLLLLMDDKNGANGEFGRISNFPAKNRVVRTDEAPTLRDLRQIEILRRKGHSRPRPLVYKNLQEKANVDVALDELISTQSKIIRRALETARLFLENGMNPAPITAVTVDELGAQLERLLLDQLHPERGRPTPRNAAQEIEKTDDRSKEEGGNGERKPEKKIVQSLQNLEALQRLITRIIRKKNIPELHALLGALEPLTETLEKREKDRALADDSKPNDSLTRTLHWQYEDFLKAFRQCDRDFFEDDSSLQWIIQEGEDKATLAKKFPDYIPPEPLELGNQTVIQEQEYGKNRNTEE